MESQETTHVITLTDTQYKYLTFIVGAFENTSGITYGEWVVLNEILVAMKMTPRDFTDDLDYEAVRKAMRE
jgi:hypothetical protein